MSVRGETETTRVSCDGGWCWLRFGADDRELTEMVAVGARRVMLGGEELLYAPEANYVAARWDGGALAVETDAAGEWRIARGTCAEVGVNGGGLMLAGEGFMCAFEGVETVRPGRAQIKNFDGEVEDAALV